MVTGWILGHLGTVISPYTKILIAKKIICHGIGMIPSQYVQLVVLLAISYGVNQAYQMLSGMQKKNMVSR